MRPFWGAIIAPLGLPARLGLPTADRLLATLRGEACPVSTAIEVELVVRGSTGPAARH